MLKRCAIAVLCVLIASLLGQAFAEGTAASHHHPGDHAVSVLGDDAGLEHRTHPHGHDLDEHDTLAHVLDHLSANLEQGVLTTSPGLARVVPPEPTAAILQTAPTFLYRPPRPVAQT